MTTTIRFALAQRAILPVPPSANAYWRYVGNHPTISEAARAYKAAVKLIASSQGMRPWSGPIAITVTWYRKIKAGDLDNRLKVALDSLRGVSYYDDSQIVEIHAHRREDKKNPRIEVEVSVWQEECSDGK